MSKTPIHQEAISGEFLPIVRYDDLHNRYANSIFGLHHASQPLRYSQEYAYDRDLMLQDLGDDVHPVRHMSYTEAEIVRPLLTAQNMIGSEQFDTDQIMALRTAALLHDIGECEHAEILEETGYTVGDVWWEIKKSEDGSNETFIRQFLYGKLYPDLPRSLLDAADDIIDHKGGTLTREAFYAAERLGYYKTALKAGEVALSLLSELSDENELRFTQLGRLALRVTSNHRPFLQTQSERFPHLEAILKTNEGLDYGVHSMLDKVVPVGRQW